MAIRMGMWRCGCGATNPGPEERCVCGRAREKDVKFFKPSDAPVVTDPARLVEAAAGPNWHCGHCGGANDAALTRCEGCGNARDGEDEETPVRSYAPGAAPASAEDASRAAREEELAEDRARRAERVSLAQAPDGDGSGRVPVLIILAVLAALAVLGVIIYGVVASRTVSAPVVESSWERSVEVQALRTFTEEGWDAPAGARVIDEERRLRRHDQVLTGHTPRQVTTPVRVKDGTEPYVCGETDLGNGYFRDEICHRDTFRNDTKTETVYDPVYASVPVYEDWLTYEVDRWTAQRTDWASGDARAEPSWPETRLGPGEREATRRESYRVVYEWDGKRRRAELDIGGWRSAVAAGEVSISVTPWGSVMRVSPPGSE